MLRKGSLTGLLLFGIFWCWKPDFPADSWCFIG